MAADLPLGVGQHRAIDLDQRRLHAWLPKHVSTFRDRHGKAHYRYRRTGFVTYYFKHEPGTDAFLAELRACNDGVSAPEIETGANRAAVGTFDDLLSRYYRSPDFLDPGERTRVVYRGTLERWSAGARGRARGGVTARSWSASCSPATLRQCSPNCCRIGPRRTCCASGSRR
ncbi:hypothetical protein [Sphingomonas sp. UV9]|uniref:hypothetical protein n=1 Tax=Sphingomonas sp. UV9 TaxID=1851410 RepID=UPI001F0BFC10|nr:hypothetical protein [Sphingomonas sp. UV9]